MSKRDDLIAKYAADIKEKLGQTPDMDLLTKVTIGCGPIHLQRRQRNRRRQRQGRAGAGEDELPDQEARPGPTGRT